MANSDKNILITTNKGQSAQPTMQFTGADNTPMNINVLDDGTLSFSGTGGQLFAVTNDLSGTIFSVNDITGVPSFEVDDTGAVRIAAYSNTAATPVLVGRNSPVAGVTASLQIEGGLRVGGDGGYTLPSSDGNSGQVLVTNGSGVMSFADQSGGGGGASDETALFYAIAFGQF